MAAIKKPLLKADGTIDKRCLRAKPKDMPEKARHYKWKKGQSGNPNGKPKGTIDSRSATFAQLLEKIGAEGIQDDPLVHDNLKRKFRSRKDLTKKEAAMRITYNLALKGIPWAVHYIADRTEGKPKEHVTIVDQTVVIDAESIDKNEPQQGEEYCTDDSTDDHGA